MRLVAIAAVSSALACQDRSYRVVVHVPGYGARAARVEVAVLESCDDVETPGDDPVSAIRVVEAREAAVGSLRPGRYALYGRAWEADCTMYAAGCAPIEAEANGEGTLEVTLVEIPHRDCAVSEACIGLHCVHVPDGGGEGDSGLPPAFVDDTDEDFGQGDPGAFTVVEDGAVRLVPDARAGVFESRVFVAGRDDARARALSWVPLGPYGKGLPEASAGADEVAAYARGGADVSDLVLLLHLDGALGDSVGDGMLVEDASGLGHDAVMVDMTEPGDSRYADGRVGGALFVRRDDYLRIPDALVDGDFRFGMDDFTWAVWVRIEGCEPSEDNVIALGGEIPHVWLGAACPDGNAWFQVHDDEHLGEGVGSSASIVDALWHHLVGVKTASRTLLYVDGAEVASLEQVLGVFSNFTKDLLIGNFPLGDAPVYTYRSELTVDELAVFRRALSDDEVRDLYLRAALRLQLQIRACPAAGCGEVPFVGPDGTGATFFSEGEQHGLPEDLVGASFQYRAVLQSDVAGMTPVLDRVELTVE